MKDSSKDTERVHRQRGARVGGSRPRWWPDTGGERIRLWETGRFNRADVVRGGYARWNALRGGI
jgi:hypothetical protein